MRTPKWPWDPKCGSSSPTVDAALEAWARSSVTTGTKESRCSDAVRRKLKMYCSSCARSDGVIPERSSIGTYSRSTLQSPKTCIANSRSGPRRRPTSSSSPGPSRKPSAGGARSSRRAGARRSCLPGAPTWPWWHTTCCSTPTPARRPGWSQARTSIRPPGRTPTLKPPAPRGKWGSAVKRTTATSARPSPAASSPQRLANRGATSGAGAKPLAPGSAPTL
mmetsp:Transcript_89617/g.262001  ORF Transcript_89617/g.262001 Transcript_89617/m.262001 type:complete len:221 (+) Transcript_89617:1383-2045(+)